MMLIVNNLYKKEAKLINEQYYETVNNLLISRHVKQV